jgi:type II secretory pathway pseudopilin PulG
MKGPRPIRGLLRLGLTRRKRGRRSYRVTSRQQSNPLTVRARVANRSLPTAHRPLPTRPGLTIVEMLVAMAITLLIMAAVVTVFANVSSSVTRRRATIEMSSALRNVRETLARDLAGATCPAVPWQRPESNVGYIEIIEGPQNDYYPSIWLFDGTDSDSVTDSVTDSIGSVPGIDLRLSSLPGSNLGGTAANDFNGHGLLIGSNMPIGPGTSDVTENIPTDGRGLGDGDDTLMLTVRNEKEPFVGRIPARMSGATPSNSAFTAWSQDREEVESPLAEVVWYALENPVDPNRTFAFGEPGFRTIYRRTLLILPDVNYGIDVIPSGIDFNPSNVAGVLAGPGVVRVLGPGIGKDDSAQALAALIGFQERFDLSVRLEWDPMLPDGNSSPPTDTPGRWVLRANTLGDLTKRENRYEHHGFGAVASDRYFPFAAVTSGIHGNAASIPVRFLRDPELPAVNANGFSALTTGLEGATRTVVAFERAAGGSGGEYAARPFAYFNDGSQYPATVRAILNEEGQVVHLTAGIAPLGGSTIPGQGRRGEDVMMTDALAFDLRVYDPGAPLYAYYSGGVTTRPADVVLQPGDPAWINAYTTDTQSSLVGDNVPLVTAGYPFAYQGQGAFVDLGYRLSAIDPSTNPPRLVDRFNRYVANDSWEASAAAGRVRSMFFFAGRIQNATANVVDPSVNLTERVATYDTWSSHYENNGVNEDGDDTAGYLMGSTDPDATGRPAVDEGTNGLDDPAIYGAPPATAETRYGPDDDAERETRAPYDTALRGLQVSLRAYERDSRQIREVRVKESFVPE